MKEAEITAIDYEPRWASVSLDHIAKSWMSIFEPGRWMRINGVFEEFVEVGGFELGMASEVDFGG